MSELKIKGVPIGEYPDLMPEARIVYRTPPEFVGDGFNHLITLLKIREDDFILSFWTWCQDHRYKTEVKGTWYLEDRNLNKKQLHAFQRMDFGGMKISGGKAA